MIEFKEKVLDNGLKIICNYDPTSPLVAVNILYQVGSRNENPNQTGMAHLFEHLMFSGSQNAPDYDLPLQNAGGENNAFTNADITNYYDILPAQNIETALWLESDRMQFLNLTQKNVDIQKKVVIEEFYETCLNRPYGDIWHHVSDMCYKSYPYKWPTIGYTPEHVESIKLADAENFYKRHYDPTNAILSISGNIKEEKAFGLVEKWFGNLKANGPGSNTFEDEKSQSIARTKTVHAEVPTPSYMLAFPMCHRQHPDYYILDLISDIFGHGRSSRLYRKYIQDTSLCTSISAYISGTHGPGLFIFDAKPSSSTSIDQVREAIWSEIELLATDGVYEKELQKIKNGLVSYMAFSETSIMNKAMSLGYFRNLGDTSLINDQINIYNKVTPEDIIRVANTYIKPSKSNELIYIPIDK